MPAKPVTTAVFTVGMIIGLFVCLSTLASSGVAQMPDKVLRGVVSVTITGDNVQAGTNGSYRLSLQFGSSLGKLTQVNASKMKLTGRGKELESGAPVEFSIPVASAVRAGDSVLVIEVTKPIPAGAQLVLEQGALARTNKKGKVKDELAAQNYVIQNGLQAVFDARVVRDEAISETELRLTFEPALPSFNQVNTGDWSLNATAMNAATGQTEAFPIRISAAKIQDNSNLLITANGPIPEGTKIQGSVGGLALTFPDAETGREIVVTELVSIDYTVASGVKKFADIRITADAVQHLKQADGSPDNKSIVTLTLDPAVAAQFTHSDVNGIEMMGTAINPVDMAEIPITINVSNPQYNPSTRQLTFTTDRLSSQDGTVFLSKGVFTRNVTLAGKNYILTQSNALQPKTTQGVDPYTFTLTLRSFEPTDINMFSKAIAYPNSADPVLAPPDGLSDIDRENNYRVRLMDFMNKRNPALVSKALSVYDDPKIKATTGNEPFFRLAIAGLVGTAGEHMIEPYRNGQVEFIKFATPSDPSVGFQTFRNSSGSLRIFANVALKFEDPLLYSNITGHEPFHSDDVKAGRPEEVSITAGDRMLMIQQLLTDPTLLQAPNGSSTLPRFTRANLSVLLALLNSGKGTFPNIGVFQINPNAQVFPGGIVKKDINDLYSSLSDSDSPIDQNFKTLIQNIFPSSTALPTSTTFSSYRDFLDRNGQSLISPKQLIDIAHLLKLKISITNTPENFLNSVSVEPKSDLDNLSFCSHELKESDWQQ